MGANREEGTRMTWSTLKYRSLLGFFPIGNAEEGLEMVVVERPLQDVKLPPKWVGKRDDVRRW